MSVGRFAPSTTGPAHPGTLLAALLCWLDARARGGRVWLRLEDLDPQRCRPEHAEAMRRDLSWLGLEWDGEQLQSTLRARHEAALDRLAEGGALYPCTCSRREIRSAGLRAPDGGYRYRNTCRGRALPPGGWRETGAPLRARLDEGRVEVRGEEGDDLSGDSAASFGDPVVRRRDGAMAYHLASVVDDDDLGVTRVVRGRDLAASTALQVALRRLLGLAEPVHRHHLLLLEEHGGKLAKLHGAVSLDALRPHYDAEALVGWLARACGLDAPSRVAPEELVAGFDWSCVAREDRLVRWQGGELLLVASNEQEVRP